ncbi:MAG: site-specific integrase [Myxococcales bacterium]|nr:site-specific integrase [Myxococcales bacterium]
MRLDRNTRRDIENFQTWRQEGNPVRDLAPVKLGTDENGQAITRPRIIEPVDAPKISDDCKVLSVILHYAKELHLISNVPKAKALPEIAKNDRVQVWTAAEVDELFAALFETARNLLPMTICLLNTGMRKGEVIAMPWDWIDLIAGMIRIQPNEYWQPKNGKPRDVPIADVLRPWLEVPVDKRPRDKDGRPNRHVFPSRKATRYKSWPQDTWDRARDLSGIGGSPHVCRHTYASHFLANYDHHEKGDALFVLSKILGHSHARVTALYSHLLPHHLEAARNVVSFAPRLRDVSLKTAMSRRLLTFGSGSVPSTRPFAPHQQHC